MKSKQHRNANKRGKYSEKILAQLYKDAGFDAERVDRGFDFGVSDIDVRVKELPELKNDSKSRAKFIHHTLFKEIEEKYCKQEGDIGVLFSHQKFSKTGLITIRAEFFMELLKIYYKEKTKLPFQTLTKEEVKNTIFLTGIRGLKKED